MSNPAGLIPQRLLAAIRAARVVSFDIFDTALVRATERPVDAFVLLAHQAGIEDTLGFAARRVAAEAAARKSAWEQERATEVTLPGIYVHFDGGGMPPVDLLMEQERALELRLCRRHPMMGAAYDLAMGLGKQVGFISDIYLDQPLIVEMLRRNGYPHWHFLLVSSATGVTKATGELFRRALGRDGCGPGEYLHIGDNPDSDEAQARRMGYATWLIPKCAAELVTSPVGRRLGRARVMPIELGSTALPTRPASMDGIWHSLWRGLVAAEQARNDQDFWCSLGYSHVGMLLLGFALWLGRLADAQGIPRLYYLARDGHIMHRVHEALRRRGIVRCPGRYLYASRRSWNIPALLSIDEQASDFLVSGTSRLTVGEFLRRIGLDPELYRQEIHAVGLEDPGYKVLSGTDYGRLRALFRSLAPLLLDQAADERRILRQYLEQEQLFEHETIGLVDIGWHGSLQDSLQSLLTLFGHPGRVTGYYLGTFPPALRRVVAGARHQAYVCEGGEPAYRYAIIRRCVEVFEWLFCAPHGGVLRFATGLGDEGIIPVLEPTTLEAVRHATAQQMQVGALAFIDDVLGCFPVQSPPPPIPADLALGLMADLLLRPTADEARQLGDLPHAEGFGSVVQVRAIARPTASILKPWAWPRLFKEYHTSFWRSGYARRLRPDGW